MFFGNGFVNIYEIKKNGYIYVNQTKNNVSESKRNSKMISKIEIMYSFLTFISPEERDRIRALTHTK